MRYRLAALMLLFVLPIMYPFATSAPDRTNATRKLRPPEHQSDDVRRMLVDRPFAILDIGPPPKEKTAEEHCKEQIGYLTAKGGMVFLVWCDPEVQKLRLFESVRFLTGKDLEPWLEKTIQVTPEKGARRLRFSSRAGTRAEQVVIINTLLRVYDRDFVTKPIQKREKILRMNEKAAPLAEVLKDVQDVNARMQLQMQREESLVRDAQFREDIARLKQVAVIKWAK